MAAEGCYIETDGTVSIPAGKYMRSVSNGTLTPRCVKGLGYETDCLQMGKPFGKMEPTRDWNKRAHTEYDFYTFTGGNARVNVYALPVFPLNKESDTRYGVQIDDGIIQWMGAPSKEYSTPWKLNVIKNSALSTLALNLDKPGRHTLKLYCIDPGMVLQKVVIDLGGERHSYLGAPVSPLIQNTSTLAMEQE